MALKANQYLKGQNLHLKFQNDKEKHDFYYWFLPENSFVTYGIYNCFTIHSISGAPFMHFRLHLEIFFNFSTSYKSKFFNAITNN